MDLAGLRDRLTKLDADLLALIAERQRLSEEVARAKRATGHPTRDFQREREVLLNARTAAAKLGLPPALADSLLRLLIRSSLATQEQAQVVAQGQGAMRLRSPTRPDRSAPARIGRTGSRTTCRTKSSSSRRRSASRHRSSNNSRAIGRQASCSTLAL